MQYRVEPPCNENLKPTHCRNPYPACLLLDISLNIAEGYGRYHYLERLPFLYIARGS